VHHIIAKSQKIMAKVIAPFKIVGTLDDLTFYLDQENNNLVKTKGNPGITKEQFKNNPIFQKVKNHGAEFGRCSKKGQVFRKLAHYFNSRAKDGSYAGRVNKLMLDILNEDQTNPTGLRTVEKGMESEDAKEYFVGFEGNKLRPLKKVLKAKWNWNANESQITINKLNPKKHIDWPEEAEFVSIAIARANWNYIDDTFTTEYSSEILIDKEEKPLDIKLETKIPTGNHVQLTFLFIGFSLKNRKTTKELKRNNNTVSIIWSH
jgi:hypothetical protein